MLRDNACLSYIFVIKSEHLLEVIRLHRVVQCQNQNHMSGFKPRLLVIHSSLCTNLIHR